ncbi:MAG: tRNA pseudouridine(38-40) synthase TruA [Desulfobulbaceae bacterium]|nr:tRNA pseudouridine(38-40) synthase TruA [Desulfobulbaceae bacterium]
MRNIKLTISYDGTDFSGWQRQVNAPTIQGEIERCLTLMSNEKISLHGAGRTDAGVHAENMVAHFGTKSALSCKNLLRGLNSMLPGAIRVISVTDVDLNFHARFSAKGKRYQYSLYTGKIQPPQLRLYSVHVTDKLNLPEVDICLKLLEGTHDFASFENSGSRDKSISSGRGAVRTIHKAELIEHPPFLLSFNFSGDGFLRNMIRNIMGTLLAVGRGKLSTTEFSEILKAKDRTMAAATAPAHGLFLKEVIYESSTGD